MVIWYAGIITLVGALIIIIITLLVITSQDSEAPAGVVVPRLYFLRSLYFLVLVAIGIVLLIVTLPYMPYPELQASSPEITVKVVGRMWSWQIDPPKNRLGGVLGEPGDLQIVLPVGKAIEFQVGAGDVNHGFGIYDTKGKLMTQVQAMPGYINRLIVTFDSPGTYEVLCMEYCGMAHHRMFSSFRVE